VGRYELGKMGFLLSEAAANFDDKFGYVKKRRDAQVKSLANAEGPTRHKIGALLEKTRATLKKMPRLSKYQAIFKGESQYKEFMQWAKSDEPVQEHAWLPEKEAGDGFLSVSGCGNWLHEFKARRAARKERRKWGAWFHKVTTEYYMMGLYSLLKRGRIQEPQPAEDYLYEFNQFYSMA
jgi:hypothetical protein